MLLGKVMILKSVIRTLAWATYIFWIILIFFSVTAIYSAIQLAQGFRFGEPQATTHDGTATLSLPLHINNAGFYDITNLNLTTSISDSSGTSISNSSTFVQLIPRGRESSITHNISLSAGSMNSSRLSHLLFTDDNLTVDATVTMDYARVIPFALGTNLSMPWGAPLSNLTLGIISMSGASATVPFSFENHSLFELDGTIRLEIVDNLDNVVGQGTRNILALPQSNYSDSITVGVSGVPAAERLYFQTSVFSYGPVVIPLV